MTIPRLYTLLCTLGLIAIILFMSGCSTYQGVIAERSATASDEALSATLWALCNATPVGAIKRRFRTESEQAAYDAMCAE